MKTAILYIFLIFCSLFLSAQTGKIDSLRHILSSPGGALDTNRVNTINNLAYSFYAINPDSTIFFAQRANILAEKLGYTKGEATAYIYTGIGYYVKGNYSNAIANDLKALKMFAEMGDKAGQENSLDNIGNVYDVQGDYPKALEYDLKALGIAEETGDKQAQAGVLGNIGLIYKEQSDYPRALDYDLKALGMAEETGNKKVQTNTLSNIGSLYDDQGDYPKALDYFLKALKMAEEIGNKEGQATNLGNVGNIYTEQGYYTKALDYSLKALKMEEETGDKEGQEAVLGNIGNIYYSQGDSSFAKGNVKIAIEDMYPKALNYFLKALKMAEEIGDKDGQAINQSGIGVLDIKTGKFKEAEEYLKKAITLDSNLGERNELSQNEEIISHLYDTTGRYKLAFIWYKKAMVLKDTLFNIEKNKALTRKEVTYQFEKKEAIQKAQQDAEVKKQKIILYSVSGGLLLVLLFAAGIFRSLQINRKKTKIIIEQKAEVEKKNILIEEKNKDILDSMTYAKRLQDAILPPLSIIGKYLPESFLLYKPKDIVAGDFYWMERAGDTILIAAADCTGHGVPGAMVSVICSNALNRAVKEFRITEPGRILDKVRELLLETFEKSESDVKDGMDISLCAINTQTKEVQWSGANNPLWYIQNGELKEMLPDKQPIGKFDLSKPFNTSSLKLVKGDTLYLFTDGYADQFGGPKGKKFKYKQLQEKLLAMTFMSMNEQKEILDDIIESWKGSLEQVDDILIMGIRV